MLALISLLAVLIGCANWLTIGLLQFDFVAGLFGSQSNIFSRIVYVVIGICAVVLTVNIIKNKGRIAFNFKKLKAGNNQPALAPAESSNDFAKDNNHNSTSYSHINENSHYNESKSMQEHSQKFHQPNNSYTNESGKDYSKNDIKSLSNQLKDRHNYNKNLKQK